MINYPITCTTYATKMAFIERAMRLLQEEHNIMSSWYDPTKPIITEITYQKLRAAVQTRWPYTTEKLSSIEWNNYQKERFDKKMNILLGERGILREALYASTRFSPNIDDDIVID